MFAVDAVRSGWSGRPAVACGISSGPRGARHGGVAGCTGAGDPSGADSPAKVDEALHTRLTGLLQVLQDSLVSGLSAVNDLLSRLAAGASDGTEGAGAGANGAAVAAEVSLRERTTLRFVTQQGDIVELELRARAGLSVAAASGTSGDATVSAATARLVSGSSFEIHVRGDLNDEELAAIGDVLGKVEALAAQFRSGDVAAAFATAGKLQIDGAQLASVAVDMRRSARVQAVGAATTAATSAPQVRATAGGYLAGALDQLDAAGAVVTQFGLRQKLQLLLQATTQAAPAGDPAVGKLAESLQALG